MVSFVGTAVVPLDSGPEARVVFRDEGAHRLGLFLLQARRAFDVGEQERHRPRGQSSPEVRHQRPRLRSRRLGLEVSEPLCHGRHDLLRQLGHLGEEALELTATQHLD
jgi:hypothetical protein